MMGLNILVGVAPQRPVKAPDGLAFVDPNGAGDCRKRDAPEPQLNDLLLALGDPMTQDGLDFPIFAEEKNVSAFGTRGRNGRGFQLQALYLQYHDARCRGLSVRVTCAGGRAFLLDYRNARGRQRRMTLGEFKPDPTKPDHFGIAQARGAKAAEGCRCGGFSTTSSEFRDC
jgi:hypothetical protein